MQRFLPLVIGFVFAAFSPALLVNAAFTDVPFSHPYLQAIQYVQEEGIVDGYPDGSFRADSMINRAEFTKILIASQFSQNVIESCLNNIQSLFTDTPLDAWFTPFLCTAFRNNIVSGYPDVSFRPSNNISYAEASKMIKETFGVSWVNPGTSCTANYDQWLETSGRLDDEANPYWWQKFVCALQAVDAMPPSYVKPEQLVTRGEMAEMIYRLRAADSQSSIGTAAWKEYTNEEVGLRFSYPSNFSVGVEEDEHDQDFEFILYQGEDDIPMFEIFVSTNNDDQIEMMSLSEMPLEIQSEADIIYEIRKGPDGKLTIISAEEKNPQSGENAFGGASNLYTADNGSTYFIFYIFYNSGPNYQKIFEQVIESIEILAK